MPLIGQEKSKNRRDKMEQWGLWILLISFCVKVEI